MASSLPSDVRKVTVVGAGLMGQQIALQASLRGFQVVLHDIDEEPLRFFRSYMENPESIIRREFPFLFEDSGQQAVDVLGAYQRIRISTDPRVAADCELLVESVTEKLLVKRAVFHQFHQMCPRHTIFTTNSSTLIPSALAAATGRPKQFASLHFALGSWLVEIMAHPGTSAECLATIDRFACQVSDLAIHCRRESRGHALNKLLMAFNATALDLAMEGVATPQDIDRLCMKSYGAKIGPFGTLDGVGLDTVYAITELMAATGKDPLGPPRLEFLRQYIDQGMLGKKTRKGFYVYPHPEYEEPDFLNNSPPHVARETASLATAPGIGPTAAPADEPAGPEKRLMGRFALTMVEAPLHAGSRPTPGPPGAALIVGDNPTAAALQRHLLRDGQVVHRLSSQMSVEDALDQVDAAWDSGPLNSLFLVTARDPQAASALDDPAAWTRRRQAGVFLPFQVSQRWFQLVQQQELTHKATLVAITSLGGDFGLSGRSAAVEGGALAGLLKSLRVEAPGLARVKVVDAAAAEPPDELAAFVFRELAAPDAADIEVACVNGRRRVMRACRERPGDLPCRHLTPGAAWVVTGGARGITAIAARRFAHRHRLRLHLLGTSPAGQLDPRWRDMPEQDVLREVAAAATEETWKAVSETRKMLEIDRNLRACAADGIQATYHSCDVGDRDQLGELLERIRRTDGPIRGVIHGAGVDTTLPFAMIPPRSLEQVVRAKLDGAAALIAGTREDPLEFFIGFGSTSGRFGAACNADYALANEMLCKMVGYVRTLRPECVSLSLHWTAWDDAGMCMRPRSRRGVEMMNLKLMPSEEGAAHLIEAIERASDRRELLITDHPGGIHSSHSTMAHLD